MKMISLDNGNTFLTATEAMPIIQERNLWDVVVNFMSDELREEAHMYATGDSLRFLWYYLALTDSDLIIG